ncbi:hypothetical protein HanRHA438_Chr09g0419561 [Helianthus annuus]|nr:hypothetical protein HanLR1_Chr09g0335101 [Helianthus annuus]KAJ0890058.1 hypothetical protein HanRHA438_Chr09g0419561 [Helianthus annuus]
MICGCGLAPTPRPCSFEQGIIERMRIGGCSTNQWKQSMKALHEPMKKRADSGHKPLAYTTKSRIGITLARTRKREVNG